MPQRKDFSKKTYWILAIKATCTLMAIHLQVLVFDLAAQAALLPQQQQHHHLEAFEMPSLGWREG